MMRWLVIVAGLAAMIGTAVADGLDAAVGKALFDRQWIAAPASTDAADGLGPLFNAKSCNACHRAGGAARFTAEGSESRAAGLVVKVARPDGSPHPQLGTQIQDHAIAGLDAEGEIIPTVASGRLAVGTRVHDGTGGPYITEVRIAPTLRGRGLLELIDERAVMALSDPDDRNGDGVSGRPSLIRQPGGSIALGRFGLKGTAASLEMQTAEAAAIDLGLSSPLRDRPFGDCTALQADCLERPTGSSQRFGGHEISNDVVGLIADYLRTLKQPEHAAAGEGPKLFSQAGCAACHQPAMPDVTGRPLPVFTDLLLHDLGPESAGTIASADVSPSEWRTAPLIDLDPAMGTRRYLHDGKAPTIEAAIGYHGGEASRARDAFNALADRERQELLNYLSGL